jgi:hypothetical protein
MLAPRSSQRLTGNSTAELYPIPNRAYGQITVD